MEIRKIKEEVLCPYCAGEGYIERIEATPISIEPTYVQETCWLCGGTGTIFDEVGEYDWLDDVSEEEQTVVEV